MSYCASMSSSSFFVKTENTGRVLTKMEKCGYQAWLDDNGNITEVEFRGDKLSFGEDEMFQAIAPYVQSGSFIEMHGEDGDQWRWVFQNGVCEEIHPEIKWPK